MKILGLSCYYHDSAACLIEDGKIIAAAQEERFTRIKHDSNFPVHAVRYCLAEAGISNEGVDAVAFYDKPILKFHRILETFFGVCPRGLRPYMQALPVWMKEKLWILPRIQDSLREIGVTPPKDSFFTEHHEAHAASAFYPSPFEKAAILTMDGVGEWATSSLGIGEGHRIRILEEIHFPHSLGLLYSAFTYFTGFRVNSGEYKLMGLAPYGKGRYTQLIKEKLIGIKPDGSFRLNMEYFGYLNDLVMTNDRFARLFDGPARKPESPLTVREMDLARSIQEVTEEIVLKAARHARESTGMENLCLAGGVALNCVANGRLLREGLFKDLWIQPAAGDAGGSLGAALAVWHNVLGRERQSDGRHDRMQGSYLGPEFSEDQIKEYLDAHGCVYRRLAEGDFAQAIARFIAEENVVGLFQGRMEFGPRALGNRSIIGDVRSEKMQSIMNLKIKYRESFRPFAPSCLEEDISDYFEIDRPSPYMLLVAPVSRGRCLSVDGHESPSDLRTWVNQKRSDIPAVTHVDYSARIQSVNRHTNPRYHALITAFKALTGYGIIINTSFNVRGEPIVCTPEDAYRCFMRTEMDYLSLGPFLLKKTDQPQWQEKVNWKQEFQLD
ncbi:MAG: carbamoyltransferase [Acidobacteria bacterium]|nr:carbamoyltransferase [Acidobacteriota bacterium]